MGQTAIWAHRGASGTEIENTLDAFELALEQQADGLELDVHLSADNRLIVTHDENTSRVTGEDAWIKDLSADKIRQMNFGAFQSVSTHTPAPFLEEVLELIRNRDVTLNIELKNSIVPYPGMEERVLAAVKSFGLQERVIYSSFNHDSMEKIRGVDALAKTGLLFTKPGWRPWKKALRLKAQALHPYYKNLMNPCFMDRCRAAGLAVNVWTVNSEAVIRFALQKRCSAPSPMIRISRLAPAMRINLK